MRFVLFCFQIVPFLIEDLVLEEEMNVGSNTEFSQFWDMLSVLEARYW